MVAPKSSKNCKDLQNGYSSRHWRRIVNKRHFYYLQRIRNRILQKTTVSKKFYHVEEKTENTISNNKYLNKECWDNLVVYSNTNIQFTNVETVLNNNYFNTFKCDRITQSQDINNYSIKIKEVHCNEKSNSHSNVPEIMCCTSNEAVNDFHNSSTTYKNLQTIDNEIISSFQKDVRNEVASTELNEDEIFNDNFVYKYSDDEDSDYESDTDVSIIYNKNSIGNLFTDNNVHVKDNGRKRSFSPMTVSNLLKEVITPWAVECNITHNSLSKLLHRVRDKIPELSLPLDPRTVLKTPKYTQIDIINGGYYCHFGLKKCFEKIIKKRLLSNCNDNKVDLMLFMDGAPLGASTEKNMWLILCSDRIIKDVFLVGIFVGECKPNDSNEFLKELVKDCIELVNNGVVTNDIFYIINIYAVICDTPAKAFVLNVKYHSGYNSCTKCTIEGTMYNCVSFPQEKWRLRTDHEFKCYAYMNDYQRKETIMNQIPRLRLVTGVPLDPMHLIYLGVTRKLILIWLVSPSLHKLPKKKRDEIDKILLLLKDYIPYEFAHRPRKLKHIKFYKATEFRQFILYTGIIALKNVISHDVYLNFLTFHIAVTILSSRLLCKQKRFVSYAELLLQKFVNDFEKLYGPQYVSHNVHNLLHLVTDVRKYGDLENFSAFRFENFIGQVKKLIRKGTERLQQLMRRCAELEILQEEKFSFDISQFITGLTKQHFEGPVSNKLVDISQYKCAQFKSFKINCDDSKNNCLLIDNKYIVNALNFVCLQNNEVYIIGRPMQIKSNLYDYPYSSSNLGIHVVRDVVAEIAMWNVNKITSKLFKLPYQGNLVIFPILHTYFQSNNEKEI